MAVTCGYGSGRVRGGGGRESDSVGRAQGEKIWCLLGRQWHGGSVGEPPGRRGLMKVVEYGEVVVSVRTWLLDLTNEDS
ncbi:hypothetical protein E2562_012329 [Oryza meyeriana var. granulata]|uniref:Uncharacterized protein n=1 Tax=Oryza meyeriana var. granulata TaxID=110450 RepID=A0A6G1DI02_9ORYZ|nr:hypothetical protein E2562_012329 [Oryza meyeriana var. granulata]